MKTVLTIGHTHFLFPDSGKAAKCMELLSKALPIERDYDRSDGSYREFWRERDVEQIQVTILKPGTHVKTKKQEGHKAKKATKTKSLPYSPLLLTDGND